jgi:hypothetical protein
LCFVWSCMIGRVYQNLIDGKWANNYGYHCDA